MYIETQDGDCIRLDNGVYKVTMGEHKYAIKTCGGRILGVYKRDNECQEVYKSLLDAIRLDKKYFKIPQDTYVPTESFIKVFARESREFEFSTGVIKCANCGHILNTFSNETLVRLPWYTLPFRLKDILKSYENEYCPKCNAIFKNSKQECYKYIFNEED